MIKVRVPATSANMGPGFDSMGIAFGLYACVDFEETNGGLVITGCPERFCNEDNLCVLGYRKAMEAMHLSFQGLRIHIESDIPVTHGLGSSSSLLTAGVFAANCLHGESLSHEEMLDLLNALEGHPDNVAPALYGGVTAGFLMDGHPQVAHLKISDVFHFTAVIPDYPISTAKARAMLPEKVDLKDAVYNLSRTAVLCRSLEIGDTLMAGKAWTDRLHQPYRKTLIPEYDEVERIARQEGAFAFCISGSGSTMLAVSDSEDTAGKIAARILSDRPAWKVLGLPVDTAGACIVEN